MNERHGPVIGVIGGSGGVGASTFAAVLGVLAGGHGAGSVLIDLDVCGGGVDVLLGIEAVRGARWSGLQLAGGRLDPDSLRSGLPRAGPCAVLAADVAELDPEDVHQVVRVAAADGPVVLDLPRSGCRERAAALLHCDLVVVIARADVAGLVAAHALVEALPDLPTGAVLRRGEVATDRAAALVGVRSLGVLPALTATCREFDAARLPRAAARVAAGVLSGTWPGTWPGPGPSPGRGERAARPDDAAPARPPGAETREPVAW